MLRLDKVRKTYSADLTHRTYGRVHLALKTKNSDVAMRRHTALVQLLDTGAPVRDVVEALRARKLSIVAVEECVRAKLPFDTLRPSTWPALGEARDRYVKTLRGREGDKGSTKTTANAVSALRLAVAHFGADRRLEAITHDDVDGFKAALLARGLHSNTIGLYLTKFGALFTYLQQGENRRARHQKRAPATLFSPLDAKEHVPASVQTRVRWLTEAEAAALLAASPATIAAAVALGLFAGLRVNEVTMLRPGVDVSLEHGVVFIQSRPGWKPKYGKNREVPISAVLRPYLAAHLATLPDGAPFCFPGAAAGTGRSVHQLQRIVTRVVGDAGLVAGRTAADGVTFHTLRHTFASWLVMAGADLLTISKLMGHKGVKQLIDTYGHLSPGHLQQTVELLSARWQRASDIDRSTSTTSHTATHAN